MKKDNTKGLIILFHALFHNNNENILVICLEIKSNEQNIYYIAGPETPFWTIHVLSFFRNNLRFECNQSILLTVRLWCTHRQSFTGWKTKGDPDLFSLTISTSKTLFKWNLKPCWDGIYTKSSLTTSTISSSLSDLEEVTHVLELWLWAKESPSQERTCVFRDGVEVGNESVIELWTGMKTQDWDKGKPAQLVYSTPA